MTSRQDSLPLLLHRRYAWVELPRLSAERHAQERDVDPRAPLALWEEAGGARRVAACSSSSAARGVAPGMSLAAARARVEELRDAPHDPAADVAALAALAEALLAFTPSLAPRPPFGVALEVGRCAHLFGGEEAMLRAVADAVRRMGYTASCAVADGEQAARVLARGRALSGGAGTAIAPRGQTAAVLAPLPARAMPLPEGVLETLEHLGIDTVGAFAALPAAAVATRAGPEAAATFRAVSGREVPASMPAFHPAPRLVEAAELEGPVRSGEGLLFRVRALLDRLEERLRGRGEGATSLTVWFDLEGEERASLPVALARATRRSPTLLRMVRERLSSLQVEAPIAGVAVEVSGTAPLRGAQAGLFASASQEETLAEALSRLEGAFGAVSVFVAVPRDRHRPEAAWAGEPFSPPAGSPAPLSLQPRPAPSPDLPPPRRPLALLHPPEPVDVLGPGGLAAPGAALLLRGRRLEVASVRGPERLAGEWWTREPFDREYFEVTLAGGARSWVFRDAGSGEHFVHGWCE